MVTEELLKKLIEEKKKLKSWLEDRIKAYEEYEVLSEEENGVLIGYKRTLYELEKIERED